MSLVLLGIPEFDQPGRHWRCTGRFSAIAWRLSKREEATVDGEPEKLVECPNYEDEE
jgi:hypothetical protein